MSIDIRLTQILLKINRELLEGFIQMARTADTVAAELVATKQGFDTYVTTSNAVIADLKAQIAAGSGNTVPDSVDTASATLAADVNNTPLPTSSPVTPPPTANQGLFPTAPTI